MAKKEDLAKVEEKINTTIKDNKKMMDNTINGAITRMSKLEKEMEMLNKERTIWRAEKEAWEKKREMEHEEWKQEKLLMLKEIKDLQEEVTLLKSQAHEEGEITEANKEVIKMEIVESVSKTIEGKMEAAKDGWVQVVKKNLKQEVTKEVAEITHKEVVSSTLEEEKRRRARRLNIRVSGIKETNATPEEDGKSLCLKLGLGEEETAPFTKEWRGPQPQDTAQPKALLLQFPNEVSRNAFIRHRALLRDLPGDPIYFDDDLTWLQREHRRSLMPMIAEARKEGKKAFYRDGHAVIEGRVIS